MKKVTEKQIRAIKNLSKFLGIKPEAIQTIQEANTLIKKLIVQVDEKESKMNEMVAFLED